MTTFAGAWTEAEVESYLAETTVPLRLACTTPRGDLWMLSLWFSYEDGELLCATGRDAEVVRYLEAAPEVAFEISTNEPPYHGVRGRGVATLTEDADKSLLKRLIERYLGGTDSSLAKRLLADDREEVRIAIASDKVYSWDYSERMADAV
ncbi:pyridoxamine 5'-phosphate oxidase family protein [Haladaptatus sp. GCM10025707]|uniref:pyridoxamine 5'-phosphate oxidase family protein n=1 Tax=unclassified Haladaptatus TaxID=2622732 RepID=UPI0023E8076B|nr:MULTISPECIES: pyridoxamine 5'-phosphate oxidase family protein [unclassified Haladaptatus]